MNSKIVEFLKKKGYIDPDLMLNQSYYQLIKNWINIWEGKQGWFDLVDNHKNKMETFSLGIAKRSCEDLASMLTSEDYEIIAKSNKDVLLKLQQEVNLEAQLPEIIETIAYSGTVGTIARIKHATLNETEMTLSRNEKTRINLINVKADQIFPLRIDNGKIIDCAFVSETEVLHEGKMVKAFYIEVHRLVEQGYQVDNIYLDKKKFNEIAVENMASTYNTLSAVPLFAIGKLNKVNTFRHSMGLGESLFACAIDQLKLVDLTYNNFGMDFKLGKKIMIINKSLTKEEIVDVKQEDGTIKQEKRIIYPSETNQQLFQETGISSIKSDQDNMYIHEYNPDLRIGDNKDGVQFALDNYSFKVGFGVNYYQFNSAGNVTATEYVGQKQDLIVNGRKNRKAIEKYLIDLSRALLQCEAMLSNSTIDPMQEIQIVEVDNFLISTEQEKAEYRTEISMGVRTIEEYRMHFFGETEEEAKKVLENDIEEVVVE